MKLQVERDHLAEAVAWTARALPARPTAPVLAGMRLHATAELTLSTFDYEVSAQAHPGQYGGGRTGRQGTRGPGHGVRQMIAFNLELHGNCLLEQGGFAGKGPVSVCMSPGIAEVPRRFPRTWPTWVLFFLIERTVIVIGAVDSGEKPCHPRPAAVFLPTGDVPEKGTARPSCGRRAAPPRLATGCPPVIRMSSTMLSTNCAHTDHLPVQFVRACCLMRLVSSVTWV